MAVQDLSEEQRPSSVDRTFTTGRGGSIGLVLLVCLALIAAAGGFLLVGRDNSGPYVLVFLGVLAMVGVFALFALACGIMRVGNGSGHPVLKAMADTEVRKHMIAASMVPTSSPTPESFKDFVATESAKWKQVVAQINAAGNGKDSH